MLALAQAVSNEQSAELGPRLRPIRGRTRLKDVVRRAGPPVAVLEYSGGRQIGYMSALTIKQ